MTPKLFFTLFVLLCSIICQAEELPGRETLPSVLIKDMPHVFQKPDFCGEACVEMYLKRLGYDISQDEVFNVSGLDPALGRGCYTKELLQALDTLGFKLEDSERICNRIKPEKANSGLDECFKRLHSALLKGFPSIVCMHYNDKPNTTEHFRLIVGYDANADELIYMEPAEKNSTPRRMSRSLFFNLWPLKYSKDEWIAVMIRLEPDKIRLPERPVPRSIIQGTGINKPADCNASVYTNADYAQRVRIIRERFSKDKLNYCIEKPFVVVGDLEAGVLKKYAETSIRWAVSKLKESYFEHDPSRILCIWLLSNAKTYEYYSEQLTRSRPATPYGYFSSANDALVMNIATGGGTLIHEIVHPFMEMNFPDCPPWLNEGMGSLYEQCAERNGKIIGLTNWRLAGLKQAIRAKDLPDFKTLTGYSRDAFYNGSKGNNYAQARYLCYYLQEKGLLEKYYKAFRAKCSEDPSGYATLLCVLGVKDMKKFQQEWENYVMKLSFP